MTYEPDGDKQDERQIEEPERAKAEREQVKKDREAQRAKVRKDLATPKNVS
jgi:hypothetical protein